MIGGNLLTLLLGIIVGQEINMPRLLPKIQRFMQEIARSHNDARPNPEGTTT